MISLMVDQVQKFMAKGVNAIIASSGGREGQVAINSLAGTLDSYSLLILLPMLCLPGAGVGVGFPA